MSWGVYIVRRSGKACWLPPLPAQQLESTSIQEISPMSFSTNTARRLSLGVVVAALTATGTALSQSTSYANGYGAQPTQPAFPVSDTSYCSGSPVIADQTLVGKSGDELGPVSETFNANFPTVLSNCTSGQTIEIAPNTASG